MDCNLAESGGARNALSEKRFFIGSYTKMGGPGVGMCGLRGSELRLVCGDSLPNATFVIQNRGGTMIYAISSDSTDGSEGGSVGAYRVDGDGLVLLSRVNTIGAGPCHLCLDVSERFLYTANYFTGSISAFALDEHGSILSRIQHIRHTGHSVHPVRQTSPHVHQVTFIPGTNKLCAVDLGLDRLAVYEQNSENGTLEFFSASSVPARFGPRHLLYAPNDMVYLACEVDNRVAVLKWNGSIFDMLQALSTLPDGYTDKNTASAIRMRGGRVYVSNRGHDSIAVYDIGDSGYLTLCGCFRTSGGFPRDFDFIDDDTIVIGHQNGALTLEKFTESGLRLINRLDIMGCVCVSI